MTQITFTFSKSATEILEKGVKYVQSQGLTVAFEKGQGFLQK